MITRVKEWVKKETVLCVSAVCAAATMILVPPDEAYPDYMDWRVLCLLFCLMTVVAGFRACGAFQWLTVQMVHRCGGGRGMSVALVLLPFFSAMLVTNDVALLTFVPFTLLLLEHIGCRKAVVPMLVLQTVAANLGSMATPVGNPQNLYLYAAYELTAGEFFSAVLPLTAVSLVGVVLAALPVLPRELDVPELGTEKLEKEKLWTYGWLFGLCLLTVFRVLPYGAVTGVVIATILWRDRERLKEADVSLLLTFLCFFIVSGNLGRMEGVRLALQSALERSTLFTAVLTSQVISNVPAAVLLSGFTQQWRPLLEGVNIGGLGTPVASLASLITLKLYLGSEGARVGRFLGVFTLVNLIGLGVLIPLALVF